MTPLEFRARLKALGITLRRFGALTGTHQVTVSYWGRRRAGRAEEAQFPAWVPLLVAAWEGKPPPAGG